MTIRIENGKLITPEGKQKREYYSFWVHIFSGKDSISISGWKYFPDTQSISSPSVMKGQGRFINTTKTSKEFFNKVLYEATQYFSESQVIDSVQEETTA